jgi:hypothetical protein
MSRIVAVLAVLMGTGCAASAEPIDMAVMAGLLALRTLSERTVVHRHAAH